jgi:hypothetical protein
MFEILAFKVLLRVELENSSCLIWKIENKILVLKG